VAGKSHLAGRNQVFFGYRWPSENLVSVHEKRLLHALHALQALQSLPTLPRGLWFTSGVVSVVLLARMMRAAPAGWREAALLGLLLLSVGVTTVIATLVLLRLSVYFRDSFRASYYGAPDLVELVRQLDYRLEEEFKKQGIELRDERRVKLSFLAHSLGNSLVTSALRVLADAFEPEARGNNQGFDQAKKPSRRIGNTLMLDRLVMVAPDIPVESVVPRRSNGLRSTLRRMRESYVFSNEGDLALRLASTAANFFSFSAQSRFSGYRLGNLTLSHFEGRKDRRGRPLKYGIAITDKGIPDQPIRHLEVRASSVEHRLLAEDPFQPWVAERESHVTNLPSYFDCTDALDGKRGLVSQARRRPALNLIDYLPLLGAYILFNLNHRWGVDTHGGYFRGETGRLLIYTLAFAGYATLIEQLQHEGTDLDRFCRERQIQVALSMREQGISPFLTSTPRS